MNIRTFVSAAVVAGCIAAGAYQVTRDIPVDLDLTDAAGVTFDFRCENPKFMPRCVFYYRSGGGWYGSRVVEAGKPGVWQRVRMPKLSRIELKPSGWGKIDAVRLSALFRSKAETCGFEIRDIRPIRSDGSVLVVRGASCARARPKLAKEIYDYALTFDETFDAMGVTAAVVDDTDLTSSHLSRAKLLILPYNAELPADKAPLVRDYISRGGAVLVCYTVTKGVFPSRLENRCYAARGAAKEGCWPKRVHEGNVVYSGHVWHGSRRDGGLTRRAREYFCELIGLNSPWLEKRMRAHFARHCAQEVKEAAAVRDRVAPRPGERRVIWAHSPLGVRGQPGDWEYPVKVLKANGFTDMLVNVCWGYGSAYDSKVLPRAPVATDIGWEPLDACRSACRRHGVKMHAWRVCWQVFGFPRSEKGAAEELAKAGRMQVDFDGKASPCWLCPNHPENRKLEMDAMLELALEKDVDGIHYDYFRYADSPTKWCFCRRCRTLFEHETGRKIANWPADVRRDPVLKSAWSAFKRKTLSGVIGPVAERVHREKPGVEISIAARPDPAYARNHDGQDWPEWCRKGWIDFVCPMDYSRSVETFKGKFEPQIPLSHGVTLLPGVGIFNFPDDGLSFRRFAEQVEAVRDAGLPGITLYSYTLRSLEFLELLGQTGNPSDGSKRKE